ncbi:MAG: MotA/TolQ/ExbB proton channel family protein [Treponema sp.]
MTGTVEFLRRMILSGGVINFVIIAEYVLMLIIVSERLVYYLATSYNRRKLFTLFDSLESADYNKNAPANILLKKYKSAAPFALASYFFENKNMDKVQLNEALDRKVLGFSRLLNARLDMLSLLANIAPLCGLLGTVTGLMAAFDQIQKLGGAVNISALAGGIWSAMITTATGLLAAIPALVAVRLFERELSKRMDDVTMLLSILKQKYRPDTLGSEVSELSGE